MIGLALFNSCTEEQRTLTIPSPEGRYGPKDTIAITLLAKENSEFRLLHPQFKKAFWNEEELIGEIIETFGLSNQSSQNEIIEAAAGFHKKLGIQRNHNVVQNTKHDPSLALSAIDFHSIQCGMYVRKAANITKLLTEHLRSDKIALREVSLKGHQAAEYWSDDLQKWIYIDPDAGTTVFVPRSKGRPVSFEEVRMNPEILLDTTGSTWHKDYETRNDSLSRKIYYDFLTSMLDSVVYWPVKSYFEDGRDIFYRLPINARMTFEVVIKRLYLNASAISPSLNSKCIAAAQQVNDKTVMQCLNELALESGLDAELLLSFMQNGKITLDDSLHFERGYYSDWYISIILPSGDYRKKDFFIPNLLRSIEPSKSGIPFQVNGTTYSDSVFFQMYWPRSPENPPSIDVETIQYGATCSIPPSIDSVTFTFYFNHRLFEFWKRDWDIIVSQGNLEVMQSY